MTPDQSPEPEVPAKKAPAKKTTAKKTAAKKAPTKAAAKKSPTTTAARAAASAQPSPSGTKPPRRAVILGGNRTPFGRAGKAYASASNQDLLTAAIDGLVARYGLAGVQLGEVAAGAVLKHSKDFNLTRESVLGSALDPRTPAYDVQQACATGLEAFVTLANKIQLGQTDSAIAGGVDSTSDAPIAVGDALRKALIKLSYAKTAGQKAKILASIRPKHLTPAPPRVDEPRTGLSMGEHQAITTLQWGVTREAQDELALASHVNLAKAYDDGFFDDLITPFHGLARDENLRADTTLEKLATLKPVFGKRLEGEATMTAGNSTPLSDGASAVLVASEDWAAERGLTPLAAFVDAQSAAVDFVHGTDGLLMAPVFAVPTLLRRNNLTFDDLDFIEIHEAFASTVLSALAAWESEEFGRERLGLDGAFGTVDRARLNVIGSSLAAGHPFAATGGRILASTAKLLAQRKAETGRTARALISVCAAGGLGVAAILESA
ncbi:MAG: acetyl-CoA C-acetyltransferase [Actinomycetales bacterium]|nr:acetyl-CoA C-acetyltransferase [Actinomycetales bacterium]